MTHTTNATLDVVDDGPATPVDLSHSEGDVGRLLAGYFEAKSSQDRAGVMAFYSREQTSHNDGTLGWVRDSWEAIDEIYAEYMPGWAGARIYPTRILGNEQSAVLFVTEGPEFFGGEIRALSAVDFKDGKITRWVDYWDGRNFGIEATAHMRLPDDQFPPTFGEGDLAEHAGAKLSGAATALNAALSTGDLEHALELFAPDAALEDLTLRTRVRGKAAIAAYLRRAAADLPYGTGAEVRRVLGGDLGGGYEWTNAKHLVPRGIVALALDREGLISRLTAVWDGSLLETEVLAGLAREAIEP